MPAEPNLMGYLLYLLFIFLPGIGLGELLNLWRKEDCLSERLGLAFELGLAADTVILMVRTSGLSEFGFTLRGVETTTVYFTILVGVAALATSAGMRKRILLPTRPKWGDFPLFLMVPVMVSMNSLQISEIDDYARQMNESHVD